MVFTLNLPKGFYINNSYVMADNKEYIDSSIVSKYTKDAKELQAFDNIPGGLYIIKKLSAETAKVQNGNVKTWRELNLKFKKADNNAENYKFMDLQPGSIKYMGSIYFFDIEKKDEMLASIAKILKKTPTEILKAVLYESELTSGKTKGHYMFIRLDHPALIGELESLKIEKNVWEALFSDKRREPTPQWDQLLNKRMKEIDKRIALLSKNKKK